MNPFLSLMLPSPAGWRRSAPAVIPRQPRPQRLPDIVVDNGMLYRSECFAEDLQQAASDAALADLFPMLRVRRPAAAAR